jgi:hypothetical protein
MRTKGFHTHVLLVLAGAFAVLVSLSRPWYARAPKPVNDENLPIGDVNGPLNGFMHGLQRWVSDPHGHTGWHALSTVGQILAACTVFSVMAAVACLLPTGQRLFNELLRYASLAVLGLVAWRLVDPPGPNELWELRNGALIALGGALMLWVCAQAVANAPNRARTVSPAYVPPPPPPAYDTAR